MEAFWPTLKRTNPAPSSASMNKNATDAPASFLTRSPRGNKRNAHRHRPTTRKTDNPLVSLWLYSIIVSICGAFGTTWPLQSGQWSPQPNRRNPSSDRIVRPQSGLRCTVELTVLSVARNAWWVRLFGKRAAAGDAKLDRRQEFVPQRTRRIPQTDTCGLRDRRVVPQTYLFSIGYNSCETGAESASEGVSHGYSSWKRSRPPSDH